MSAAGAEPAGERKSWFAAHFGDLWRGPWTGAKVAAWPLLLLVRCYQAVLSPLLPQSCRFYPSCSAYAVTALTRFGPIKGGWLAARRVGRCHPWNPGGVDHVPDRDAPPAPAALHHH